MLSAAAVAIAYYVTSLILAPTFRFEVIFAVFQELIMKDYGMFTYLSLVLSGGVVIIVIHCREVQRFYRRKMFHALAFFLFLPAIIFAKFDSPRFITLAMNCVIVAMILLEAARYKRMLPGGRGKHYLRNTL